MKKIFFKFIFTPLAKIYFISQDFYHKYYIIINIILLIISIIVIPICLYYFYHVVIDYLEVQAYFATKKGIETTQLCIAYLDNRLEFLKQMVPETHFRVWFHAVYEHLKDSHQRIFYDMMERPYYVIDFDNMGDLFHNYCQTIRQPLSNSVIELIYGSIAELDPAHYGAIVSNPDDARRTIETVNETFVEAGKMISKQIDLKSSTPVTVMVVLVTAIGVCTYICYKLCTS